MSFMDTSSDCISAECALRSRHLAKVSRTAKISL